MIHFSSPNKIGPLSSIPRHVTLNSSSLSLSGELDISDYSTDNSQTDDLISFTSNDFSIEHNDELISQHDEISDAEIKNPEVESNVSEEKNANTEKSINVPEYRVSQKCS